jgi:hypothetical protein
LNGDSEMNAVTDRNPCIPAISCRRVYARLLGGACAAILLGTAPLRAQQVDPPDRDYSNGSRQEDPAVLRTLPSEQTYRAYIPTSVDLSYRLPDPGDQGSAQACTAWATAYAARSYYTAVFESRDTRDKKNIASPAFVYNLAWRHDKDPACNSGSTYFSNVEVLKRGAPSLADYPFRDTDCSAPPQATVARSTDFRVLGLRRIDRTRVDDMKGALARSNPVLISFHDDTAWHKLRGPGVFDRAAIDHETGWHSMAVVGYDERKQAFRLINSWGKGWGDNGYAWVGYETLKARIREAYILQVSRPATPPRPPAPVRPQPDIAEVMPPPAPPAPVRPAPRPVPPPIAQVKPPPAPPVMPVPNSPPPQLTQVMPAPVGMRPAPVPPPSPPPAQMMPVPVPVPQQPVQVMPTPYPAPPPVAQVNPAPPPPDEMTTAPYQVAPPVAQVAPPAQMMPAPVPEQGPPPAPSVDPAPVMPAPLPIGPAPAPPQGPSDLAALTCGRVAARREGNRNILEGYVGSENDFALVQAVAAQTPGTSVGDLLFAPWPQCEAIQTLERPLAVDDRPEIDLGPTNQLRNGDPLRIMIRAPGQISYLYVSYVQADGSVVHLVQPDGLVPRPTLPHQELSFGDGRDGGARFTVSPPFGPEMIIAIASRSPLFDHALPPHQTEREYLTELRRALIYKPSPELPDRELSASITTLLTEPR